jgi:hypothetical protein
MDDNKKCRQINGNLDCLGNASVQRGVHCLMEHIRGFSQSHWIPPSVECLCRIALAAIMVNDFGRKH